MWLLYLCIKPETSETQQKRFHAIVKVKNFTTFPAFPIGASEGLLYAARVTMCSVKKIGILGPAACLQCTSS